jgi:putative tryptophan/tyrosine transport system substrate-binding protein
MDRRRFLLTSLAGVVAAPLGAEAQQAGKIPKIGWLTSSLVHAPNPSNEGARTSLPAIEAATKALGVQVQPLAASDIEELDRRLSGAVRSPGAAMLTVADAFLWSQRARIVSLAARHCLPGMYPEREFALEGGLMAYGSSVPDNFRRAAGYVDRILKGVRPADLPIEQPTKFDLVINLKTAKALGLTIPPSLLLRADQVIE